MRKAFLFFLLACVYAPFLTAQTKVSQMSIVPSYREGARDSVRSMQYVPRGNAFFCENGTNRYTRALYGSHTDWRLETSDRPVFAVVKKGHHRNIRFVVNGVPLDATDYCAASYEAGVRRYVLRDRRWNEAELQVEVVAMTDQETAVWRFLPSRRLQLQTMVSPIASPKLQRNGDIGADAPGVLEAADVLLQQEEMTLDGECYLEMKVDTLLAVDKMRGKEDFLRTVADLKELASRVQFNTPDPYINTLGGALVLAADGDCDGQTWLHGCVGWRMPLAGWRAGYLGDVLGWNDRAVSHFNAYAKSQVTDVPATIPHPSQDSTLHLARAEKKWGTQMYSNGYICRNPERNDQMHHYDMNLNYMDELLWHFQYDADTAYMRKMWPVIQSHLAWEKRNYDPDGDHLYDAYCCIWASDALYYSGGAVTHSSAYNYRGNKLAARIAELIGENPQPYAQEADAILKAMNSRLWLPETGVWAEYQDALGLQRLHEHPALWSIYTPIDCGACSPEQAFQATCYVDNCVPHVNVENTGYQTIATSDWMPYSWSINNVAAAEVMHTALAYFEAGRSDEGYRLMKGNILDQMYYGASPGNFGQLSYYDAARGECYRDFGDCIGISARTLIQGLFGIVPQALDGKCFIRPGFPADWDSASIKTPYLEYQFTRKNGVDRYEITQNFRQPLQIVVRQNMGNGQVRDIVGTNEPFQVIEVATCLPEEDSLLIVVDDWLEKTTEDRGLGEPDLKKKCKPQDLASFFNAKVDDIFKNKYLAPRPQTTTLQIPCQGVGEWCHPQYTPEVNDSVFRSLIVNDHLVVAGIPFRTPKEGANIIYTSLWDNYPDAVTLPLKGRASRAYLLMAGSTNHMQSRMDNGLVIATYSDGSSDTLCLRNPDNWCPIEQDYYIDGKQFHTVWPRPYRVCLGKAADDGLPLVSRNLGEALHIEGVYGREIPGGAAQLLTMPLQFDKRLRSITVRTLSNDVVIGLMAVTLQ